MAEIFCQSRRLPIADCQLANWLLSIGGNWQSLGQRLPPGGTDPHFGSDANRQSAFGNRQSCYSLLLHYLIKPMLEPQQIKWAKVIDNTRCIGCHACTTACKSENIVPVGVTRTYVKHVDIGISPGAPRAPGHALQSMRACSLRHCLPDDGHVQARRRHRRFR